MNNNKRSLVTIVSLVIYTSTCWVFYIVYGVVHPPRTCMLFSFGLQDILSPIHVDIPHGGIPFKHYVNGSLDHMYSETFLSEIDVSILA